MATFLGAAAAGVATGATATAGTSVAGLALVFFATFLGAAALIVVLVAEVLLLDISTHSMPSMTSSERINFYVTALPIFASLPDFFLFFLKSLQDSAETSS
jgi:hypothetical protein